MLTNRLLKPKLELAPVARQRRWSRLGGGVRLRGVKTVSSRHPRRGSHGAHLLKFRVYI